MTGTNVTTDERKEERAEMRELVSGLPVQTQHALTLAKMSSVVAKEIANLSWGKSLSAATARSIAQWGMDNGVEVLTEIDILGGKLYLNANFYRRQLAALVDENKVDGFDPVMVHRDSRLDELAAAFDRDAEKAQDPEEAQELRAAARRQRSEQRKRSELRAQYGIPDAATGACLFYLYLRALDRPIIGKNWCGGGTRNSDPVGNTEPVKTAETRALRRAVMLARTHVPKTAKYIEMVETSAGTWKASVEQDLATLREQEASSAITHRHVVGVEDSYGAPQITPGAAATVEVHDAGTAAVVNEDRAIDAEIAGQERGE